MFVSLWFSVNLTTFLCSIPENPDTNSEFKPMSGLFEVMGMMDETVFRKIVSDSKIVTPGK